MCENCEKLRAELAQVKADKTKAEEAVIRYANKLLMVRRVIDDYDVLIGWPE